LRPKPLHDVFPFQPLLHSTYETSE
jgi:hypothetical protein